MTWNMRSQRTVTLEHGFNEDDANDSKFVAMGVILDEGPSAKLSEHNIGGQRKETLVNAEHVVEGDCQPPLEKNSWEEHQAYYYLSSSRVIREGK